MMLVQRAPNFCPTVTEGNICLVKLTVTNTAIIHYKDIDDDEDDPNVAGVNVCNFSCL